MGSAYKSDGRDGRCIRSARGGGSGTLRQTTVRHKFGCRIIPESGLAKHVPKYVPYNRCKPSEFNHDYQDTRPSHTICKHTPEPLHDYI